MGSAEHIDIGISAQDPLLWVRPGPRFVPGVKIAPPKTRGLDPRVPGVIVVLLVVVVPAYAETGVPPFQTNPPGGQDKYEPKGIVFARKCK